MIGKSLFLAVFSFFLVSSAAFGQARVIARTGEVVLVEPVAGGYLGVQMKEITKKNFGDYDLTEVRGVAVDAVAEDSPADRAGIKKGDVIIRFAGEEVSSIQKLTRLLGETAPDHTTKITVLRGGGNEIELTATLGERAPRRTQIVPPTTIYPYPGIYGIPRYPLPQSGAQVIPLPPTIIEDDDVFARRRSSRGASRQIGVTATALTKQLADYLSVAGGEGLLVDTVRANSPADKSGIKAGDVIVEADGKAIATTADLIAALDAKKEGDVTLVIVRDKNRQTIKVTPEPSKSAPTKK